MKNYTKPTFMLASLGVNALAAGTNCSISSEDKEIISGILGESDWNDGFGLGEENCTIPVVGYCKFTSTYEAGTDDNGNAIVKQAFFS